jgi:NAD(P)-dependent dehydrogenase (short-subunit alcohol dehydrogenase family)
MYAAAKAGLLSFTRSTAAALGPERIRVNAVCPGPIETEIFASNSPEAQQEITAATALRRAGRPEEMVGPILFLCSTAASYLTGEVLMANGGHRGT